MINNLKALIEHNRQAGTTTALINMLTFYQDTQGYIVVSSAERKQQLIDKHPSIKGKILTLQEIEQGAGRGTQPTKIFFVYDAVYVLAGMNKETITKLSTLRLNDCGIYDGKKFIVIECNCSPDKIMILYENGIQTDIFAPNIYDPEVIFLGVGERTIGIKWPDNK